MRISEIIDIGNTLHLNDVKNVTLINGKTTYSNNSIIQVYEYA